MPEEGTVNKLKEKLPRWRNAMIYRGTTLNLDTKGRNKAVSEAVRLQHTQDDRMTVKQKATGIKMLRPWAEYRTWVSKQQPAAAFLNYVYKIKITQ